MNRLLFLLACVAGIAHAGIAVSDTTINSADWLLLRSQGKGKPRLTIASGKATLELAGGQRVEFRAGHGEALVAGHTRTLKPTPRIAEGHLLLPRKPAQDLLEGEFPSQFLCEEDGCRFTRAAGTAAPEKPVVARPAVAKPESVRVKESKPVAPDSPQAPVVSPKLRAARRGITVVVDAGHGGKDPGAHGVSPEGKTVREKDVTLAVAKKLRDDLKKAGFRVVMTRDDDFFVELKGRTEIANKAKGDLFISLHCNAVPARKESAKGFRVYLLREAQSEVDKAIERRENQAIRLEGGGKERKQSLSPIEWMQIDHQLNLYTKESERFSELVVNNLHKHGPVRKEFTGAGQAGFFVLVGALMPSVLIEMGYVSHPQEMLTLSDPDEQERIASGVARSVETFFQKRSAGN
jgi:N-acetylmuramoyl-L-alanine amidase